MTSDFTFAYIGFRCYHSHLALVKEAAAKAGVPVAEYARRVVIEWAASDMGVPVPDYQMPGAESAVIAEAAKRQGVTVAEFKRRAACDAAAKALQNLVQPAREIANEPARARKASESGTRYSVKGPGVRRVSNGARN